MSKNSETAELCVPPNNIEAEEGLLAACLLDGGREVMNVCIEMQIQPECFFKEAHGQIFNTLLELYESGSPIDEIVLFDALQKKGIDEEVGGLPAIYHIQGRIETSAHAKFHAKIVREKYIARRLIRTCREVVEGCYNQSVDLNEAANRLESEARSLAGSIVVKSDTKSSAEIVEATIANFEKFVDDPEAARPRVTTPLSKLNKMMPQGGLLPGHLIVIAARPSVGKTSLAMNIAEKAAITDEIPSLVFSLEMPGYELLCRMACSRAKVNFKDIQEKVASNSEKERLKDSFRQLRNYPLSIDAGSGNTIARIAAKARNMANFCQRKGNPLGLVVIDFLQKVPALDTKMRRDLQVGQISSYAKSLAMDLCVPVVLLSQLNRGPAKEERPPVLSDLRDSGEIEQDADEVIFLHRATGGEADVPNTPNEETIKVIGAKVRNGPTGDFLATFERRFTRFRDYGA